MVIILFNPLSNNKRGEADAKAWASEHVKGEVKFQSVIGLKYKAFFDKTTAKDEVVLCGGDGTLNYFVNEIYGYKFKCKLSFAKCGSGNDFYRDVADKEVKGRINLLPYIENLPLITVNGIKRRFLNGIGYGIDGDTCLVGDEIREKDPNAVINYTNIAIGLLLKGNGFQVKKAIVVADGKEYKYENVWLCSAMNGRYYGGGMNSAPNQDRLKNKGTCTVTTFSSKGRLTTFLRFPSFSGGKHEGKKYLSHVVGKHIIVSFDKPCALQIDGDVVKNVTQYRVDYDK